MIIPRSKYFKSSQGKIMYLRDEEREYGLRNKTRRGSRNWTRLGHTNCSVVLRRPDKEPQDCLVLCTSAKRCPLSTHGPKNARALLTADGNVHAASTNKQVNTSKTRTGRTIPYHQRDSHYGAVFVQTPYVPDTLKVPPSALYLTLTEPRRYNVLYRTLPRTLPVAFWNSSGVNFFIFHLRGIAQSSMEANTASSVQMPS